MMKPTKIIALLITLSVVSAAAQEMSLDSILAQIARRHPMLAEYRHRAAAMQAYADGATAWMAPMAGIGTFMTPYPGQRPEDMDKGAVMMSVEQSIPNPAKVKASRQALTSKADVEAARGLQQWNLLRSQARAAVYTWTIAGQQIEALQEQEKLLTLALDIARIRYEQRQGKLSDIYRTEGEIAELRNRIAAQMALKLEEESRLRALMNLPKEKRFSVRSEEPEFKPIQFTEDTARLSGNRSDIQELDARIRQMQLAKTWQQLQSKPDLRIRFDHMQPLGKTTPVQFTAMAMVSIPIAPWSSKMYRAEVAGMERDISAMQSGREALLLEARSELSRMAIRLESMRSQLERFQNEIIPALEKNLNTLRAGYQENREPLPMVLDALSELSEARQEYLTMKASYYLMITDYERLAEI